MYSALACSLTGSRYPSVLLALVSLCLGLALDLVVVYLVQKVLDTSRIAIQLAPDVSESPAFRDLSLWDVQVAGSPMFMHPFTLKWGVLVTGIRRQEGSLRNAAYPSRGPIAQEQLSSSAHLDPLNLHPYDLRRLGLYLAHKCGMFSWRVGPFCDLSSDLKLKASRSGGNARAYQRIDAYCKPAGRAVRYVELVLECHRAGTHIVGCRVHAFRALICDSSQCTDKQFPPSKIGLGSSWTSTWNWDESTSEAFCDMRQSREADVQRWDDEARLHWALSGFAQDETDVWAKEIENFGWDTDGEDSPLLDDYHTGDELEESWSDMEERAGSPLTADIWPAPASSSDTQLDISPEQKSPIAHMGAPCEAPLCDSIPQVLAGDARQTDDVPPVAEKQETVYMDEGESTLHYDDPCALLSATFLSKLGSPSFSNLVQPGSPRTPPQTPSIAPDFTHEQPPPSPISAGPTSPQPSKPAFHSSERISPLTAPDARSYVRNIVLAHLREAIDSAVREILATAAPTASPLSDSEFSTTSLLDTLELRIPSNVTVCTADGSAEEVVRTRRKTRRGGKKITALRNLQKEEARRMMELLARRSQLEEEDATGRESAVVLAHADRRSIEARDGGRAFASEEAEGGGARLRVELMHPNVFTCSLNAVAL
ncbi:hypothetical protein C8Q77DRAFT_1161287 [Trametes polyzona]|nr:hypothetical protein C8Q77DRAFT_1161287 [Trametes polyzona]